MDLSPLGARATAGTLRALEGVLLHHTRTDEGVVAGTPAYVAQLLHLSVALCVLNDTYREAERLDIKVDGIAVEADGGFDDEWRSSGIDYSVTLDSPAHALPLARVREGSAGRRLVTPTRSTFPARRHSDQPLPGHANQTLRRSG